MNTILIALAIVAVANASPLPQQSFKYVAIPTVQSNGYLADTPEVQAAKSAHYAEVAKAAAATSSSNQFSDAPVFFSSAPVVSQPSSVATKIYSSLSNPNVGVYVNDEGYVAEPVEIAKAKAIHYIALAKAVGAPIYPYVAYLKSIS